MELVEVVYDEFMALLSTLRGGESFLIMISRNSGSVCFEKNNTGCCFGVDGNDSASCVDYFVSKAINSIDAKQLSINIKPSKKQYIDESINITIRKLKHVQ